MQKVKSKSKKQKVKKIPLPTPQKASADMATNAGMVVACCDTCGNLIEATSYSHSATTHIWQLHAARITDKLPQVVLLLCSVCKPAKSSVQVCRQWKRCIRQTVATQQFDDMSCTNCLADASQQLGWYNATRHDRVARYGDKCARKFAEQRQP